MEYTVQLEWDDEVGVWIATSEDVKGLVLECGSLDALIERVKYAVPELLELNGNKHEPANLLLTSQRRIMVLS